VSFRCCVLQAAIQEVDQVTAGGNWLAIHGGVWASQSGGSFHATWEEASRRLTSASTLPPLDNGQAVIGCACAPAGTRACRWGRLYSTCTVQYGTVQKLTQYCTHRLFSVPHHWRLNSIHHTAFPLTLS